MLDLRLQLNFSAHQNPYSLFFTELSDARSVEVPLPSLNARLAFTFAQTGARPGMPSRTLEAVEHKHLVLFLALSNSLDRFMHRQ